MRKLFTIMIGLAVVSAALAVVWHRAEGRGVIAVGPDVPGSFNFRVGQEGEHLRGELHFQAGRLNNPLVRIALPNVRHAEWTRNGVRFGGPGVIERNGNRVACMVFAYAIDNRRSGHSDEDGGEDNHRPDAFGIRAVGPNQQVLFEAEGMLRAGDVVVRHGQ